MRTARFDSEASHPKRTDRRSAHRPALRRALEASMPPRSPDSTRRAAGRSRGTSPAAGNRGGFAPNSSNDRVKTNLIIGTSWSGEQLPRATACPIGVGPEAAFCWHPFCWSGCCCCRSRRWSCWSRERRRRLSPTYLVRSGRSDCWRDHTRNRPLLLWAGRTGIRETSDSARGSLGNLPESAIQHPCLAREPLVTVAPVGSGGGRRW